MIYKDAELSIAATAAAAAAGKRGGEIARLVDHVFYSISTQGWRPGLLLVLLLGFDDLSGWRLWKGLAFFVMAGGLGSPRLI